MKPTIAERVVHYIASGIHTGVCDSCVANAIRVHPTQVNSVTSLLDITGKFARTKGVCDKCGKKRKVTRRLHG